MMKIMRIAVAALLAATCFGMASAQTMPSTTPDPDINADLNNSAAIGPNNQYGDPICGTWVSGVWQDNGHCPSYVVGPHRFRLEGTITVVKGHLVTVQQSDKTVVVDDTPALNRQTSGRVAVGRRIVAYGYFRGDNYYATVIE
jgi:hypothetical protein